ncbi:MAG: hypothetical protein ABIR47_14185 [Candidatus Kapaibacterium sp.]
MLVPLKPGDQWTYRSITFDRDGSVPQTQTGSYGVLFDSVVSGRQWSFWLYDPAIWRQFAWMNRSDGFWKYYFVEHDATIYRYVRYPLAVGNIDTLDSCCWHRAAC